MRNFIDLVEGATLPLMKKQLPRYRGMYAAFVVVMRPLDFLKLTTENDAGIKSIQDRAFPYSQEKYNDIFDGDHPEDYGRFEIPFLTVKFPSGQITGHEGRHRAAMIMKDGGKSLPVMICPREEDTYEVINDFSDNDQPWVDGYWDESDNWVDGRKNIKAQSRAVFNNDADANSHRVAHILGNIQPPEGTQYDTSNTTYIRGAGQLKGAPARSSGWDKAAWKVEDFPDQLVGQFNRYYTLPKARIKIGLVKGYRHHREPVQESIKTNRTLYHGTSIEALKSIKITGLIPQLGDFTRSAYNVIDQGDYDDLLSNGEEVFGIQRDDIEDLVFAADRQGLGRCYSAMLAAIQKMTGDRSYTSDDVKKYGALLILKDKADRFEYRPRDHEPNSWNDHPYTVEPGDYYTDQYIEIDSILTGKKLVQFLVRNRIGFTGSSDMTTRQMVGKAVKILIKLGRTPEEALMRARELGQHGCYSLVMKMDD